MLGCRTWRSRRGATNHRGGLTATGLLLAALIVALPGARILITPASAQFLAAPPGATPIAPPAGDAGLAFTQRNVPAEATAADAVQAKERALAQGRRTAWQALASTAGLGGQQLNDAQIDDLVASIIVEEERLTATRYSGRITVNFAPDRVRALIAGRPMAPGGAPAPLAGGALPATPASNWVQATATYRSMGEWLELRRRLLSAAPVATLEVQSIAVDAARLRLGLRADPTAATGDLAALGVALQPGGAVPGAGDIWRVGLAGGG